MSIREVLLGAVGEIGWGNAAEIVELLEDPEITVAIASAELRAMAADGLLIRRVASNARVEYATPKLKAASLAPPAPHASPSVKFSVEKQFSDSVPPTLPERAKPAGKHPAACAQILEILAAATAPLAFGQICEHQPPLSPNSIKKALQELKEAGSVVLEGNTNKARWSLAGRTFSASAAKAPSPQSCTADSSTRIAAPARHQIRKPLGLLDRAEVVAQDLQDLLEDTCKSLQDQVLIIDLVRANNLVQLTLRRFAQA
jgi:DNA-binding HxlR family transcriptional regulator